MRARLATCVLLATLLPGSTASRAQVRPIILRDPAFPQAAIPPPLYPPRRTTFERLWSHDGGVALLDGLQPVADRVVAAFADGGLVALSGETGQPIWQTSVTGPLVHPPVIAGEAVVVASADSLIGVGFADGQSLWRQPLPTPPSTPLSGSGLEIGFAVGGDQWRIVASADGRVIAEGRLPCAVTSAPGFDTALIVFGCEDGRIVAVRRPTNEPAWERASSARVRTRPLLTSDRVYVGNDAGEFFCLKRRSGRREYRARAAQDLVTTPVMVGRAVLVGGLDNALYAFHARNGHLLWRGDASSRLVSGPAVAPRSIVLGPPLAPVVTAIDPRDGLMLGTIDLGGERVSAAAPVQAGNVLVTATRPLAGGAARLEGWSVTFEVIPVAPLGVGALAGPGEGVVRY